MSLHHDDERIFHNVVRKGSVCRVKFGLGHYQHLIGKTALKLTDTGNGFIAHFPSISSVGRDEYVSLDYSQARDLVLALSKFQSDLGFAE